MEVIELFAQDWDKKPEFYVYSYDLTAIEGHKLFQYAWDEYFARVSACADKFETSAASLMVDVTKEPKTPEKKHQKEMNLTEFGDEGKQFVYVYEKKRVADFNQRLASKVLSLGKTKGLGYDIQSVMAESGDMAEFIKYIEAKSTKRLTCPDANDNLWVDTLNITRNEWVAAQQHGKIYSVYRVYFTCDGIVMFV